MKIIEVLKSIKFWTAVGSISTAIALIYTVFFQSNTIVLKDTETRTSRLQVNKNTDGNVAKSLAYRGIKVLMGTAALNSNSSWKEHSLSANVNDKISLNIHYSIENADAKNFTIKLIETIGNDNSHSFMVVMVANGFPITTDRFVFKFNEKVKLAFLDTSYQPETNLRKNEVALPRATKESSILEKDGLNLGDITIGHWGNIVVEFNVIKDYSIDITNKTKKTHQLPDNNQTIMSGKNAERTYSTNDSKTIQTLMVTTISDDPDAWKDIISISAGDTFYFQLHYYLSNGISAINMKFLLENIDNKVFNAGANKIVTGKVLADNLSISNGLVKIHFNDKIKVLFVNTSWQASNCQSSTCESNPKNDDYQVLTSGLEVGDIGGFTNDNWKGQHYNGNVIVKFKAIAIDK